jgi:hypothetical protein
VRPSDPPASDAPPLSRSGAACLATILELSVDEVPCPGNGDPWAEWHAWLAGRGLGLVPIADPLDFNWPGPWMAVLRDSVAVVAFGAPPGLAHAPLLEEERFDQVTAGYLVAPADPALWSPRAATPSRRAAGRVEAIVIAPAAEAPMRRVRAAVAVSGRGLEGDRYVSGAGTFSNPATPGHDLTLIEAEQLEALRLASGHGLEPEDARRNVVTRGIDLNALVGRSFTVGEVRCFGQRLCEPCAHLEHMTEVGVLRGLVHRGGLRADVVSDGRIALGDEVRAVED